MPIGNSFFFRVTEGEIQTFIEGGVLNEEGILGGCRTFSTNRGLL